MDGKGEDASGTGGGSLFDWLEFFEVDFMMFGEIRQVDSPRVLPRKHGIWSDTKCACIEA